jgi:hypothetical protein
MDFRLTKLTECLNIVFHMSLHLPHPLHIVCTILDIFVQCFSPQFVYLSNFVNNFNGFLIYTVTSDPFIELLRPGECV